jgi:hypothetical protein
MSKGDQIEKTCPHTGKKYKVLNYHLRHCEGCAKDHNMESAGGDSVLPTDSRPSPEAPPRVVELDGIGTPAEKPKYMGAAQVAAQEYSKPAQQMLTDDSLGLLFKAPFKLMFPPKRPDAPGVAAVTDLPDDYVVILVQLWRGPINRALARIAGTDPELAVALIVSIPFLFIPLVQAAMYRKKLKEYEQRGPPTPKSAPKGPAQSEEELRDLLDKKLRGMQ